MNETKPSEVFQGKKRKKKKPSKVIHTHGNRKREIKKYRGNLASGLG